MISKQRIATMLFEVGQAVGVYLSDDRIETYYQKLRSFHPIPLNRAVETIIDTWDNPARFPPLGVFVSKVRHFSGEGTPNAIARYRQPAPEKPKSPEQQKREYEAITRYVEMDDNEYWDLVLEISRKRDQQQRPQLSEVSSQGA